MSVVITSRRDYRKVLLLGATVQLLLPPSLEFPADR